MIIQHINVGGLGELRSKFGRIVLIMIIGLAACSYMGRPLEFPEADGATLPDGQVGILDYAHVGRIAGIHVDGLLASNRLSYAGDYYGYSRLKPGDHTIVCERQFSSGRNLYEKITLQVEAGHRYRLEMDSCYWCKNFRAVAWIVDEDTGEVVAGHYPDWPFWML